MKQAIIQHAKDIVEKKDVCGGAPTLEGTRIRVSDIVIEYEHKYCNVILYRYEKLFKKKAVTVYCSK